MKKTPVRPIKTFKGYKKSLIDPPNPIAFHRESYDDFIQNKIKSIFEEIFPVSDYNESKFDVKFVSYELGESKYSEDESKRRFIDYSIPLSVTLSLHNKKLKINRKQKVYFGNIPKMTDRGTFIIRGVERVVVSQFIRSFGLFFLKNSLQKKKPFGAKIIPSKGVWIEFEQDTSGRVFCKVDLRKKFPATLLLRYFSKGKTRNELTSLFDDEVKDYVNSTFNMEDPDTHYALELQKHIRDGGGNTLESAMELLDTSFGPSRFDMSEMGRIRLNRRTGRSVEKKALENKTLNLDDIVFIIKEISRLNNDINAQADDIDHLGFRRVRTVGELIEMRVRIGLAKLRRNMKDRMTTADADSKDLYRIINPRLFQSSIIDFFRVGQLSQILKNHNLIDELEHLATVSSFGPGGISRERAVVEIRDIHPTHYGRVCPIHTPDGENIGLVLHFTWFTRINKYRLIEVPYAKVVNGVITSEIVYMTANDENDKVIVHNAINYNDKGVITDDFVDARLNGDPVRISKKEVQFIDVSTGQSLSMGTSLIPFVQHNTAARALFGTTMPRSSIPCLRPEAPLIATGYETIVARNTDRVMKAKDSGEVVEVDAGHIKIKTGKGKSVEYKLRKFGSGSDFVNVERPIVNLGDKVEKDQVIADLASTADGQLAIGKNLRVAFSCWSGSNFEDSILISKRLVTDDTLTSVHCNVFEIDVRDTKLGPELTTYDIPNVSENRLKNLDETGIIRIGSDVKDGDILVGKVTPRGEYQLSPEEKLLQSIFGEKAKEVKDSSLKVPTGKTGRVINIEVYEREEGYTLEPGAIKKIKITVAEIRKIQVGDKLTGRHGNKGVISKILPVEDMPYDEEGNPIDVVLTPLGVPSRQNLGQILELHLGLAANTLNYQAIVPPFTGVTEEELENELETAGFSKTGKMKLFDGRTGVEFEEPVSVGYMYILKLDHMIEDKIHARSIGQYSLVTQQPLGGRSRGGGQRLGEMEVWALLGYGAAYTLREMLTIKSDDMFGRSVAFDSIIKGERIKHTNIPASFNVLMYYLRGLGLSTEFRVPGNKIKKLN